MAPHPGHRRVPGAVVRRAQEAVAAAGAVTPVREKRGERLVLDRWELGAARLDEEEAHGAARAHLLTESLCLVTLKQAWPAAGPAPCSSPQAKRRGSSPSSGLLPVEGSERTVESW